MTQAKKGDRVRIHYEGKLEDGSVFDTTYDRFDRAELEIVVGEQNIMPALDDAIIGMEIGEKKTVTVPPEEGHGLRDEAMVLSFKRDELPNYIFPAEKTVQRVPNPKQEGDWVDGIVTHVDDKVVIVDANFPLAGQTLIFELELVDIV